ncbi:alpha/beta hydrolase [Streptomyces sp. NPDC060194]|uniref:alpha/beta hydrolase n=1 Tax=Streptomyces sp. NPDC060194 TaxID=3347069 RepID=UPI00366527CD
MRRFKRTMIAAVLAATVATTTGGWAYADAQAAVTGPPPGTAQWRADGSFGGPLPDPARATPREVAAFFRGLAAGEADRLTRTHPTVVGNLDGAPLPLRYAANARTLGLPPDTDRRVLAYDPRGRGQLVEVFGDLRNDPHTAVIVPGSDVDAGHFARTQRAARNLRAATHGTTAVVAWAGYTTPVGVGVDAATGRLAEAGAERLTRLVEGLDATGAGAPALFCHSYGSVVCGLAADDEGMDATDVVAFGSPGMRADSVAGLGTRARVWAARAPDDWIGRVPHVEFAGLGHGTDPADPAFGARRLPAADVRGHGGYMDPGTTTLAAFAAVARHDEVPGAVR